MNCYSVCFPLLVVSLIIAGFCRGFNSKHNIFLDTYELISHNRTFECVNIQEDPRKYCNIYKEEDLFLCTNQEGIVNITVFELKGKFSAGIESIISFNDCILEDHFYGWDSKNDLEKYIDFEVNDIIIRNNNLYIICVVLSVLLFIRIFYKCLGTLFTDIFHRMFICFRTFAKITKSIFQTKDTIIVANVHQTIKITPDNMVSIYPQIEGIVVMGFVPKNEKLVIAKPEDFYWTPDIV